MRRNLHQEKIVDEGNCPTQDQKNFSKQDKDIECYFKNIENVLIGKIEQADIVIGCVAWLTNKNILKALSKKLGVSIIVAKNDFLRPDIPKENKFLKLHYKKLPSTLNRYMNFKIGKRKIYPEIYGMSCCGDTSIEAVRAVGYRNDEKIKIIPLSHHKFVIFCKFKGRTCEDYLDMDGDIKPFAIWTGSYNFTHNAELSFENALYITRKSIIEAYLLEWGQVAALSEPLEWDNAWVEPEWRNGT